MWSRLREVFARELVVLVDPTNALHARRRKQLTAAVGTVFTLGMAAAMGVAPRNAYDDPLAPRIREAIRLPDLRDQLEQLTETDATFVREARMLRGDTIATLLKRLGIDDPDAQAFIRGNATARGLFALEPGQNVQAEVDQDNLLVSLQANLGGDAQSSRELVIERAGDAATPAYKARVQSVKNDVHYEMLSGAIAAGGFFKAMDDADVPDDVVAQMISIFSGVIDFHHDITAGDRFRIVYEAGYRDAAFVRNGRVVAVELINHNQLHQALWYAPDGGAQGAQGAYYTFDGRSMKRPFLRSPVEFSRVSSGFGGRNHPLHHNWAQHKGVDFAAPTGTKVMATGDGEVEFVGQQNGYGNIVILRHHSGYATYYAHLSGFAGMQRGQHVSQGQVIGYVGQTGWATGPHLHYEFRVNDVPLNPLAIAALDTPALTGPARQQFLAYSSELLSRINALRTYNVASINN
ncbi:M23 family metallopeptidase [Cupriavidus sp. WS]|uniref:M23 family metallopeptidase n=1 Tax=Cupriavidus sp. WS TaxID=1312922 RepID=UPI00037AFB25|nr:M23 family metallopeptidase [Cupriavidus sp. WS]